MYFAFIYKYNTIFKYFFPTKQYNNMLSYIQNIDI